MSAELKPTLTSRYANVGFICSRSKALRLAEDAKNSRLLGSGNATSERCGQPLSRARSSHVARMYATSGFRLLDSPELSLCETCRHSEPALDNIQGGIDFVTDCSVCQLLPADRSCYVL